MIKTKTIDGYKWESFQSNKSSIKKYLQGLSELNLINEINEKDIEHSDTKNKISDISEILFWSYIEEINSKDTSDKTIDSILNKFESRHNTILYLLNNRVLSLKSDKDESDNILKPIIYEYNHAVVNPKWQQTIEFQYRYSFSPHLLRSIPLIVDNF